MRGFIIRGPRDLLEDWGAKLQAHQSYMRETMENRYNRQALLTLSCIVIMLEFIGLLCKKKQ